MIYYSSKDVIFNNKTSKNNYKKKVIASMINVGRRNLVS